ncbi:helix-turn-helix domain-containing protein [Actinophytocola algeriensis]|uniref:Transcriptional regulator with XRE-family HTH domain n=1 Tax=Actinophytocola algeriensis TaxID=1768010 RepID=A0A7W7QFF9_9PSEU|nr:helix-turn-helix transcriptional regulator [Actinophytocola algeriensis]MBB4912519.1 transcriptional regulator with XRE-family HTH domain [Actinophytocola algeriensis]MBE1478893.1 transcriptional regulator with XRE-family HTH domain [Actinophytocola algeriensis]
MRAIRKERTELSLEQAAVLAQWSPSTMSRIETGKRHISPEDVATISTIYQLPLAQRQELIESARAGNASGWWDLPLPGVPMDMGAIASYEAEAIRLTDWSVNLVPGLLQTYRYAVGLMRSGGVAADVIEARWMARLRRQQILGNLDYYAFIGEAALRTPFGGPDALREQLRHLLGARERGIGIRIVPEHQAHSLVLHSWLLMEFPNTSPVVNVEARNGSLYLHDEIAETYLGLVGQLDRIALAAPATMALVRRILEEV